MKTLIITLILTLITISCTESPYSIQEQEPISTDSTISINSTILPHTFLCYKNYKTNPTVIQNIDTIYTHTESFKAFINHNSSIDTIPTSELTNFQECTDFLNMD